jgi:hypothetical protein
MPDRPDVAVGAGRTMSGAPRRAPHTRRTTMTTIISHSLGRSLAVVAVAALLAGCDDDDPVAPDPTAEAVATIRQATERYHDVNAAIAEGFVLLHGCENRPDEGPVGTVYVHMGRLTDGVIDPATPEALIYEPGSGGSLELVGVEFAMPYALWTEQEPPELLGATFQREDEFEVFGLHVWAWRDNPEGLFAESNPRVSCGEG